MADLGQVTLSQTSVPYAVVVVVTKNGKWECHILCLEERGRDINLINQKKKVIRVSFSVLGTFLYVRKGKAKLKTAGLNLQSF